jgi:hypothetical protein
MLSARIGVDAGVVSGRDGPFRRGVVGRPNQCLAKPGPGWTADSWRRPGATRVRCARPSATLSHDQRGAGQGRRPGNDNATKVILNQDFVSGLTQPAKLLDYFPYLAPPPES